MQLAVVVVQLLLPNEGKGKVGIDCKNHDLQKMPDETIFIVILSQSWFVLLIALLVCRWRE